VSVCGSHGNAETTSFTVCLCVCLCVDHVANKSTNFGSKYLVEEFSEEGKIWHLGTGDLPIYTSLPGLVNLLWHRGSPLGAKILKSIKKIL